MNEGSVEGMWVKTNRPVGSTEIKLVPRQPANTQRMRRRRERSAGLGDGRHRSCGPGVNLSRQIWTHKLDTLDI